MLPSQRHSVYRSMARGAADSLIHVNAVIEVNEIRQVVNLDPADGVVGAKTIAHRLERRAGIPNLRVTIHARLGRRNVGERGSLHRRMTIPAIDSQATHMMLVAK